MELLKIPPRPGIPERATRQYAMGASKKKKRSYDSASRREKAAETQKRIMNAARKLFSKRSVDQVTIDELATEANVSAPTVFALYRSKLGVLRALIHGSHFGEEYPLLLEKVRSLKDPRARLLMASEIARNIYDRERSEMGLIRAASALSPELKELERESESARFERQAETIRLLFEAGLQAPGLKRKKAHDIFWTLTGRDIYRMLVIDRGWSSSAYQEWLGSTLLQCLTRDEHG
ncbi:MAG: TetR/AcrR family transcriptional regulator [Leptospirales bacterium]|nr:TetR/AcrR family transcriptional regulator [Leptospirales bacterium]